MNSVRARLALWYSTVFFCVFALTGVAVLLTLNHVLVNDVSQRTRSAVLQVQHSFGADGDAGTGSEREAAGSALTDPDLLQTGADADVFLRVVDPAGRTLNRSPSLPPPRFAAAPPSGPSSPRPTRVSLDGEPYVFVREPLTLNNGTAGWIEGYGSLANVDRTLGWLARLLGAAALAGGLLAAVGGYLVARAAFRRVDAVIATAHQIMQGDLRQRLELRPPQDELYRLAAVFNEMLDSIEQAMERQAAFVADASHELRTPVTVISGYLNLLRRWARNDPAVGEEALDAIARETERMTRLTSRLLRLAGSGPLDPHRRQRVDLAPLLQGLCEDAQAVAEDRRIDVRAAIEPDLWVDGDPERLHEMFWAFIDNAIKYSLPGGAIDIDARPDGGHIRVRIRDTGIGMTPAQVDRIFERFYRADPARDREPDSFGLGLAIARETLRAHHGRVTVASHPNKGSTFDLTLPRRA